MLISKVSTKVSNVIVGPKSDMPRAIFARTSSLFLELKANCAKTAAFERSIISKKKNSASLKNNEFTQRNNI